jgi:hypothetical protein
MAYKYTTKITPRFQLDAEKAYEALPDLYAKACATIDDAWLRATAIVATGTEVLETIGALEDLYKYKADIAFILDAMDVGSGAPLPMEGDLVEGNDTTGQVTYTLRDRVFDGSGRYELERIVQEAHKQVIKNKMRIVALACSSTVTMSIADSLCLIREELEEAYNRYNTGLILLGPETVMEEVPDDRDIHN